MIEFDRLTLSGFKSFVDKTDLDIRPGLTGIVGPNGCGKSNLVEALRWAMGESSAKRMRGGDMDDVIFNGTSGRPARNFAEVVITLNNGMHTAPEPYRAFDQIEISRKIEREQGSTYRINGKIARARDVQLLLADTMTGANSPALVSQGKLTQIISAKPFDRRIILEESAGITGLHARRHEAELRLQAADNNLARLQDSMGGLETQLNSLKRQSRQAEKYRNLSDEIKTLETEIAAYEWIKVTRAHTAANAEVTAAEQSVADALLTTTQLTRTMETQAEDLPALRNKAAEESARYQAVAIELKQLDIQDQQIAAAIDDARGQLKQTETDIAHDQQLITDGSALMMTLEAENAQITAQIASDDGQMPALEAARDSLANDLEQQEKDLRAKTQTLIETQTRRNAVIQQINSEEGRATSGKSRLEDAQRRLNDLNANGSFSSHDDVQEQITAYEERLAELQTTLPALIDAVKSSDGDIATTRAALQAARDDLTKLQVERKTLETFLAADLSSSAYPVLDQIKADTGFEQALAKALGDTLFGSTDEQASVVWRGRNGATISAPSFPSGVAPIDERVKAPDALASALGFIGYVMDRAAGDAAAPALQPGQTIVSLDGYLWRWDGLFIKPSAKDKQAIILEQKNRLGEIETRFPSFEARVTAGEEAFHAAEAALQQARSAQNACETELRSTQNALNTARSEFQKSMQARQHHAAEQARLTELVNILTQDVAERETTLAHLRTELSTLQDPSQIGLDQEVAVLRDQVSATQGLLRDASLAVDRFAQETARRNARLHAIADERISLNNRTVRANEHLTQLQERCDQTRAKLNELLERPKVFADHRADLMSRLSGLEGAKKNAEDALQKIENDVNATTRALKEAEAALGNAREWRAGVLARLSGLTERLAAVEADMTGTFNMTPQGLMEQAKVTFEVADEVLAETDTKRARKEKLMRDRDGIGPVNLRADVEAQEIETQIGTIMTERVDLEAAIAELRDGITKINQEARERLNKAFDTINGHFKDLFTRLFAGGAAHLELIADEDPLGAGLEIYAQPPGKTLQSISLLSGGEQSLTAAALIFAMFMTNPSPICVLDEIDAPLDDANVDRICDLVRHITDVCQTRFLVVTHHRLTMARMDRLYGVTMGEKGVSQLVSVDLSKQLDFLEAA